MSFRKRSEVIGGNPMANARAPAGVSRPGVPARAPPVNGRGPPVSGRGPPVSGISASRGLITPVSSKAKEQEQFDALMKNPGVRPSLITSQPTISTGSSDLDKIMLHQGLPIGCSLLIEESGTTDFASVLLRAFASQGVIHNRLEKDQLHSHTIVIGLGAAWAKELPGLYKGSSKEQKKAKIQENESKVSVSNLSSAPSSNRAEKDMKIAWRYGLNNKKQEQENNTVYEHYNNQFDITQKLVPGPSGQDMTFVPLSNNYNHIILQLNQIIKTQLKTNSSKVIRLIVPNLLNPSIYNPAFSSPSFIIPFFHSLRALLREFSFNLSLIASLPLDLYPRFTSLTLILENLADSVIHLQPFNQQMSALIEKAYKNEPAKIQQGLVNIFKLPVLSDKGMMMVYEGEYAFKNGRKKFEIEEWGIPVEDDDSNNNNASHDGHDHGPQTTKNIDF
ncbi:PAXNEB-domain-containing protein [Hyphopichia burtonii NRRL Y-1933]|uniref:Elongator complex protein 4 n=1 Tax=Hyphopichia burtonii NRRL Y-1933 TaxID=984485 RepID=A0A1E4RIT4_9ASCO|nr:PAXNEB-domain-containing protein [Hyphopichia burtonii NRRL Y-1933]ODV67146.1 PAXNEB-domain-containing protein [Hyphopichia burtonii NRRL Y-1933]